MHHVRGFLCTWACLHPHWDARGCASLGSKRQAALGTLLKLDSCQPLLHERPLQLQPLLLLRTMQLQLLLERQRGHATCGKHTRAC